MNVDNKKDTGLAGGEIANNNAAFLVARIGNSRFALGADNVLEIVSCDAVTPLPYAPEWVLGLAHIGGRILPLLEPARLLGLASENRSDAIVVATPQSACALRVDEVIARVVVAADSLRHVESGAGFVVAEFEYEGTPVLVLEAAALGTLLATDEMPESDAGMLGDAEQRSDDNTNSQHTRCLVFRVGGAHYAMPLADIGEVIPVTAVTTIPGAPTEVTGITLLRESPLLVVSAARLLAVAADAPAAALVLESGALRIALQVDDIAGVEAFAEEKLHPLDDEQGDIVAIAHAADGRIVSLLARERLLGAQRRQQWQPLAPVTGRQQAARQRETRAYLETAIGDEHFGIALDDVRRILPWSAPEPVDSDGGIAVGAIQVEGRIVPVLDPQLLRLRERNPHYGAWVLVGDDDDDTWALAVGDARRIVRVFSDDIEMLGGNSTCLHGIAHVDAQLLSLVSFRDITTRQAAPLSAPGAAQSTTDGAP